MPGPRIPIDDLPEQTSLTDTDDTVVQVGDVTMRMRIARITSAITNAIAAHVATPTGAHEAVAISAADSGSGVNGLNVQAQLVQLAARVAADADEEGIEVGPIPPDDPEWLWADTTATGTGGGTGGTVAFANVRDYGAVGDGIADDTSAIQGALDAVPVEGGTVIFPRGTYRITADLSPTSSTYIAGDGLATVIVQETPQARVFNLMGVDGCIVENMAAEYTGGSAGWNTPATFGGAPYATNSFILTNGDGHTFRNLTATGFATPYRLIGWDPATSTWVKQPTSNVFENIVANDPNFGILISGAQHCTVRGFTVNGLVDWSSGVNPVHAVYTTDEAALGTAHMTGLHFENLHCIGGTVALASAYQFKGLLNGQVMQAESDGCIGWGTVQSCAGTTFSGLTGRGLRSNASVGAFFVDGSTRLSFSNLVLTFDAADALLLSALRGAVVQGDDITIDGLDVQYQMPTVSSVALMLGATGPVHQRVRVRSARFVNLGAAGVGRAVEFRNINDVIVEVDHESGFAQSYTIQTAPTRYYWRTTGPPISVTIVSGALSTTATHVIVAGEGGASDSFVILRRITGLNGVQGDEIYLYRGSQDITIVHTADGYIRTRTAANVVMSATANSIVHLVHDGSNWVQV